MKLTSFAKFSWAALFYTLLVILWGAYVRASGSGAGCGAHWPLCNGAVIPQAAQVQTMIEFTHRVMSGLTLLLSAGLFYWSRRAFGKGDRVRLGAALVLIFTLTEALVGAALVLFELVAGDTSVTRAVVIAVHLVNTFLLLASLTLTAWWASGGAPLRLRGQGALGRLLGIAWVAAILLGASGAVTALGDTLFPASSLAQGMQQDFSPAASFLIRLRVIHPLIAVSLAVYVTGVAVFAAKRRQSAEVRRYATGLVALFFLQLGLGALNVYLLAPMWMQMIHLLTADLVWIGLVLLSAAALKDPGLSTQAGLVPTGVMATE